MFYIHMYVYVYIYIYIYLFIYHYKYVYSCIHVGQGGGLNTWGVESCVHLLLVCFVISSVSFVMIAFVLLLYAVLLYYVFGNYCLVCCFL